MKTFLGINNIVDETRLAEGEFSVALNVDVGATGNLLRRRGRTAVATGTACHSAFQAPFGLLVVINNDLVLIVNGSIARTVYNTIGYTRVWYATLTDGRVAFSNGLICGLCTASSTTDWGVPTPGTAGEGIPGGTLYQVTYARTSDGLEGPPVYGTLIDTKQAIIGLPVRAGHKINVYFAPYGEQMFYAGSTTGDTFTHSGNPLGAQYVGGVFAAPTAGTQLTLWRSRVLWAEGNVLWATRPFNPELVDPAKDFIQMPEGITLIYGTDAGVFVGTADHLYFLAGTEFADLRSSSVAGAGAALGSVVEFDTNYIASEARPSGAGNAALCLVGGVVSLIYGAGSVVPLTATRYRTTATEVHATVRVRDGFMQYLASPV